MIEPKQLSDAALAMLGRLAADVDLCGIEPSKADGNACDELGRAGLFYIAYHLTAMGEKAVQTMRKKAAKER